MNFEQMLRTFIGRSAEVMLPSQMVDGTLVRVSAADLAVQPAAPIYGPTPTEVVVPLANIDYVRILA